MSSAQKLVDLLDYNLSINSFENAVQLFKDNKHESELLTNYSDVLQVVMKYLIGDSETELYAVCENIIKILAEKCYQEGILFEFLEIIETVRSDDVFTTILKGFQIIILRQNDSKSRSLEYCLNSIEDYILELPYPDQLKKGAEYEKMLENDDEIRRILMLYITLDLFYQPIIASEISRTQKSNSFRNNKLSRKTALSSFILRLLGKPLALLDLSHSTSTTTTTYSRQCAESLVNSFAVMVGDVFYFLAYVEQKVRWPLKGTNNFDVQDIFLIDDKVPLLALGMLFYLVIAEDILPANQPKIYSSLYIFEMGIYLVDQMLQTNEPAINFKGLKLCDRLLANVPGKISSDELDLSIHSEFCKNLVNVIVYSESKCNRSTGLGVLKNYINKFDQCGQYLVIKNLFKTCNHTGLQGYLITIYKDMIINELKNENVAKPISDYVKETHLKILLVDHMCVLKGGVACDLMNCYEQIISSLNMLIALLIRDKTNVTGFKVI